jgi:hypothetical protein
MARDVSVTKAKAQDTNEANVLQVAEPTEDMAAMAGLNPHEKNIDKCVINMQQFHTYTKTTD